MEFYHRYIKDFSLLRSYREANKIIDSNKMSILNLPVKIKKLITRAYARVIEGNISEFF